MPCANQVLCVAFKLCPQCPDFLEARGILLADVVLALAKLGLEDGWKEKRREMVVGGGGLGGRYPNLSTCAHNVVSLGVYGTYCIDLCVLAG